MSTATAINSTARLKLSSTGIPLTQNTAPVHEHRALYTHDVRRKAKRWQDGFAKFHTFNNRVMLYDEGRNLVAATFHQEAGRDGLQDGDEISLDDAAILLQIGERLATQETDLTELLAKRTPKAVEKDPAQTRRLDNPAQGNGSLLVRSSNLPPRMQGQWKGWGNKNQQSPFERRQELEVNATELNTDQPPPAKRRRRDDEHLSLFQILKTTKPKPMTEKSSVANTAAHLTRIPETAGTIRASTSKRSGKKVASDGQSRLKIKEIVDITSSADDIQTSTSLRGGIYNSSSPTKTPAPVSSVNVASAIVPQRPGTTSKTVNAVAPTRGWQQQAQENDRDTGEDQSLRKSRDKQMPCVDTAVIPASKNAANDHKRPIQNSTTKTIPKPIRNPTTKHAAPATPLRRQPPSSPPVSTTNHMSAATTPSVPHVAVDKSCELQEGEHDKQQSRPLQPPIKPLRLATKAPRSVLLCQATKPQIPSRRRSRSPVSDTVTKEVTIDNPSALARPLQKDRPLPATTHHAIQEAPSSPAFETQIVAHSSRPQPARKVIGHTALGVRSIADKENVVPQKKEPDLNSLPIIDERDMPPLDLRTRPAADYSRLDAQLLRRPGQHAHRPPVIPATLHRPFRRTMSDTTHLSPSKAVPPLHPLPTTKAADANTDQPLPKHSDLTGKVTANKGSTTILLAAQSKSRSRPLRRAETHVGIPNHDTSKGPARKITIDPRGAVIPAAQTANTNQKDNQPVEQGPWTSDAWDLLGWVPQAKVEAARAMAREDDGDGRGDGADGMSSSPQGKDVEVDGGELCYRGWMRGLLVRKGALAAVGA